MVFEWLDLASFVLMLLPNKGLNESKIIKDAQGKSAAPYNPAPYAFSIWGVIWAINIWFLVEQVINGSKLPTSLHILYIVTNLLQGGWSVSVSRNKKGQSIFFIQSELPMLFIAANIITQTSSVPLSAYLAFMLWFSWISVATTISLFEFLSRKYNIPFFEGTLWSLVLISYASALSSYFLLNRSAAAYTAVTIWGLLGIFNARVNSRPPIRYYALLMAGVLSFLIAKQKLGF